MTNALSLVRLLPLPFIGRFGQAFVEIVLAAAMLAGSVVVGHELKVWRDWYSDPATAHPWAPTPVPSAVPEADAP